MKNNKPLRISLLVAVLIVFAYYFFNNREQFERIGDLNTWQILLIIVGQAAVIFSNILMLIIFVRFLKKRISFVDSARITAYSSLINFFGFLQGGAGFRGIYLKKYFDMSLKRYFVLTAVQYLILFSLAGLLILAGVTMTTGAVQAMLIFLCGFILVGAALVVLHIVRISFYITALERLRSSSIVFQTKPLIALCFAAVVQFSGSLLASAVELQAIGANVTLGGLFIYAGISQFSVVVALTPGAIGIREALLLMVQGQMLLSSQDIIVASTIDRVVYFVTLGLYAPLAMSAKRHLS